MRAVGVTVHKYAQGVVVRLKGVVYDSGENLLIFELNSQTNTLLPSVLLQTRASNSQH